MSKRIPMFQKLLKNLEDNEINLYEAIDKLLQNN